MGPGIVDKPVGGDVTEYYASSGSSAESQTASSAPEDGASEQEEAPNAAAAAAWSCEIWAPAPSEPRLAWINPNMWMQGHGQSVCNGVLRHRLEVQFWRSSWRGDVGFGNNRVHWLAWEQQAR